jgi:hypothetical protein
MIRNPKLLGLVVVAVLAVNAMAASTAHAVVGIFTAGLTPAKHTTSSISGPQLAMHEGKVVVNAFTTPQGSMECESSKYTSEVPGGTATELTVNPTFVDCRAIGLPATVTMNGCGLTFRQPTKLAAGEYTGAVDLHCEGSVGIEVEVYFFGGITAHAMKICTIEIEPFENLNHIVYKNIVVDKKDMITVNMTVEKIPYVERDAGCPGPAVNHTTTNGVFETKFLFDAGGTDELWLSDAKP